MTLHPMPLRVKQYVPFSMKRYTSSDTKRTLDVAERYKTDDIQYFIIISGFLVCENGGNLVVELPRKLELSMQSF